MKKFKILLTGGGSGGHIYPLLAVVEELERLAIDEKLSMEFYYCGPAGGYVEALEAADIKVVPIMAGKMRRYFSFRNFLDAPKTIVGFFQALFKILALMPDVIFSKGGTGAFPVVLAGWLYRIPIVIHESDALPGVTNLLSAFFALRIAVSFERAKKYFNPEKTAVTGTPLRRELLKDRLEQRLAKKELRFNEDDPLIFVIGGSQGAQRINEFIIANLAELLREAQILHQTGEPNFAEVKNLSRAALIDTPLETELKTRYQPLPYLDKNLKTAFSAADLIVARAGSGTIFEIAAFGKPSIIIPITESANDHQRANAYEYAKTGAAMVIEEGNLLKGIFINQVKEILGNASAAEKMSEAAKQFVKLSAAEVIAREIIKISV